MSNLVPFFDLVVVEPIPFPFSLVKAIVKRFRRLLKVSSSPTVAANDRVAFKVKPGGEVEMIHLIRGAVPKIEVRRSLRD
jgi:hypothetical protein